jgi:cystathionine gamma-synthase
MESLDRSTIWPYDEQGEPRDFYYSRYGSPTVAAAEQALGELEGGEALLFPSGAGATTALVLSLLQPGDTIALAAGAYYGTGVTFSALHKWGLKHVEFDQTGAPPDGVQLIWLEAPSNPFLTMPNLEAAVAHPAPVVVDSTVATPVFLKPLEHGADYALHSATKYLAGHDDVLAGAVAGRDLADLKTFRTRTGISPAPDSAWLLSRGLKTLELRVHRQTETATVIAERLASRGPDRPLPRDQRSHLVRRRRPAPGGDLDEADRQRDEPRGRHLGDGEPRPLGRRARPAGPPAPERGPRGP